MNGCKLSACPCENVNVFATSLKDGQLATITSGGSYGYSYVGRVVQRCGTTLISVGKGAAGRWSSISKCDAKGIKVRALKAGECVQVL
jgi:hypothetical protein